MTANNANKDLQISMISSILPFTDYILLYPAILSQTSSIFNFGLLGISIVILIFLIWGIFFVY